jgi:hypothetical protein
MTGPEQEPTLDVARGDVALSRHLKNSLEVLKDKVDDPEFGRMVDDITAGRRSLRDMVRSPVFARALDPLVEQGAETYRNLSDEERETLARQGEAQFEQLRQQLNDPNPEDPDDEDFSDTNWVR